MIDELIPKIERCLNLPPNWKANPQQLKRYGWIEELESFIDDYVEMEGKVGNTEELEDELKNLKYEKSDLEDEISDLEFKVDELEDEIEDLKKLLIDNNIEYD